MRPLDPASENKDEPPLEGLTIQLVVLAAKRYAALLPARHIHLTWLQALVAIDCPALAASPQSWGFVVSLLTRDGTVPGKRGIWSGVESGPAVGEAALSMHSDDLRAAKRVLHAFCTERLEADRAEERRMINFAMTGQSNTAVTAWTVPPLEQVLARAAESGCVEVVRFGDGTYSVSRKPHDNWEMDCLKAFAAQEFAGRDLAGVEWALRSRLLTSAQLEEAKERIGEAHLGKSEDNQAAFVAGRYWLNLAHSRYGEGGSSRGSWYLCGTAVEILQRLADQNADDPLIVQLLGEAKKSQWSYDD